MSDFEKEMYAGMTSADRCFLYLVKAKELIDFARIMNEQDLAFMKKVYQAMKEGAV